MARAVRVVEDFVYTIVSGRSRPVAGRIIVIGWVLVFCLGAQSSGSSKKASDVSSGPVSKIEVYAGHNYRLGRAASGWHPDLKNDGTINDFFACQAVDAQGRGVNNVQVEWLYGYTGNCILGCIDNRTTFTSGTINGLTWVLGPAGVSSGGNWPANQILKFTARIEGDGKPPLTSDANATISVWRISQESERSGLAGSEMHETYWVNNGTEIDGNGLNDRFRGHTNKAIIVELDWGGA